jgi:hypothetical protein
MILALNPKIKNLQFYLLSPAAGLSLLVFVGGLNADVEMRSFRLAPGKSSFLRVPVFAFTPSRRLLTTSAWSLKIQIKKREYFAFVLSIHPNVDVAFENIKFRSKFYL